MKGGKYSAGIQLGRLTVELKHLTRGVLTADVMWDLKVKGITLSWNWRNGIRT